MIWQVLDVRAVWIKEFAAALSRQVPVLGWLPQFGSAALFQNREEEFLCEDPPLSIRSFPLQRGFARFPFKTLAQEKRRIIRRLSERATSPKNSPLILTSPHYASVAEWTGPVIYYVTDFFPAYHDESQLIRALDTEMCKAATIVCPNSQRIADYLNREAQCPIEKIAVVPNATRASNVFQQMPDGPGELLPDISDLPRPIAGVIGNLAENTDWILLRETIERTAWLSWVFVGPTDMAIGDREQLDARTFVMKMHGRVRFLGNKPYGELKDYARSFDVAILPYKKREPTYSGSSTRFYEHLAACRPMIATRGFEELLHKEPLLHLVNTSDEMVAALESSRQSGFTDGAEDARWRASQDETWEARAAHMIHSLSRAVRRDMEAA